MPFVVEGAKQGFYSLDPLGGSGKNGSGVLLSRSARGLGNVGSRC